MSYFSKITQVFRRIKNMEIDSCFFGEIKTFLRKRNGSATILKPYKPRVNSVFQIEITDKKALETTQEIVDTLGKEYGRTFSMAERNARRIAKLQYKKASTTEEACDYALRKLGIKSYDIPDVELANQVNLSMTRALKKSKGQITLPDRVEFVSMNVGSSSRFSSLDCPAQTLMYKDTGEVVLQINKDYYDNIDDIIGKYIKDFELNAQLATNSKGRDCIKLVSSYKYSDTLNRYYRLYKQGKLTPKAKLDFANLLENAVREEHALLASQDSLINYIKKHVGIDLKGLSKEEYVKQAKEALLKIRREQKIVLTANAYQTKNAIGVDGQILHELGHSTHFRKIKFEDFEKEVSRKFNDADDVYTALQVSPYATENQGELIGEYIKGRLSGDKYSNDVDELFERCFKGRLELNA